MNDHKINSKVWGVLCQGKVSLGRLALAASISQDVLSDWKDNPILEPDGLVKAESLGADFGVSNVFIRSVLKTWVMQSWSPNPWEAHYLIRSSEAVMEELVRWDPKLAVWCACACAELSLLESRAIRFMEPALPALAIQRTREWVKGEMTPMGCLTVAKECLNIQSDCNPAALPCGLVARAVGAEIALALDVVLSVEYSAEVFADVYMGGVRMEGKIAWEDKKKEHLMGFLPTIAEAIDTFPLHYDGSDLD